MSERLLLKGEPLLAALEDADVYFVVIGALAVAAHGCLPTTKEFAIVPDPNSQNMARLAKVLNDLEASVFEVGEDPTKKKIQPGASELAKGGNFVLTTKYGRLDVMQLVSPDLEYADLDVAAIEDEVFGHPVRFCGYEHLVAMKEAAGRDQDLLDLKHLREARGKG